MRVCGSSVFVCRLVRTGTVLGFMGTASAAGVEQDTHNDLWWRITQAPGSVI